MGKQLGPRAAAFSDWSTFGKNNYSREAAAFLKAIILNWAAIGNNNYGREAAAFLKTKYWVSFGQLGQQLGPRIGLLHELGNNWEHQLQPRSGCLFERYNWEQQLRARAAAFLKAKYWVSFGQLETTTRAAKRPPSGNGQQLGTTTTAAASWNKLGNNWEQQLQPRSGRLFEGNK